MVNELKGNFHAHITILTMDEHFIAPAGWKTTIILLSKEGRNQKDVMITRHYVSGTVKTPTVQDMLNHIRITGETLIANGHTVIREKLEHESLPTLPISVSNYRECHIKIRKPRGNVLIPVGNLVESRNPMVIAADHTVVFMNARFYGGEIEWVDLAIGELVTQLVKNNQAMNLRDNCIAIIEVKIESTVHDSNLALDKWWA